jgi:hypothetical protein
MERLAAISISLLLTLSIYALDIDTDLVLGSGDASESVAEEGGVEPESEVTGGAIVFANPSRRASSSGGGGGGRQHARALGRPPTCVTPSRGCGFVLQKDEPAPRQAPPKRGWLRLRD